MLIKNTALIIGYGLVMYVYAIPDKTHFDFISQLFTFTVLALLLDFVSKTKYKTYSYTIIVVMVSLFYAMAKQLLGIGTKFVWSDYVMWILIPTALIALLITSLIKAFKNESK